MSTFLERARGTTLEVFMQPGSSADTMTLLSPHTQQIGSLRLMYRPWTDIQRFSDVIFGPLPLLRTLEININDYRAPDQPGPSLPLFGRAVNVEEFILRSEKSPFLNHFVFPNLITFELHANPASVGLRASEILDFLEASRSLRTVEIAVKAPVVLEGVARTRVVVLPNVQSFSLDMDDGWRAYELVTHISCPSASSTSLTHQTWVNNVHTNNDLQDMFPTTTWWNTIVDQFTKSPVETVTLEIKPPQYYPTIACALIFQSFDTTVLKLNIEVFEDYDRRIQFHMSLEDMIRGVFSRAPAAIQCHPQLRGTKRLRILNRASVSDTNWPESVADGARTLINSMEFLEELTLHGCDLRLCLNRYITGAAEFGPFPLKLKELKISEPFSKEEEEAEEEECLAVVVELAKLQHMREAPIQRVSIYSERFPPALVGMLEQWVGVVDCHMEGYPE